MERPSASPLNGCLPSKYFSPNGNSPQFRNHYRPFRSPPQNSASRADGPSFQCWSTFLKGSLNTGLDLGSGSRETNSGKHLLLRIKWEKRGDRETVLARAKAFFEKKGDRETVTFSVRVRVVDFRDLVFV